MEPYRRSRWVLLRMLFGAALIVVLSGAAVATAGLLQVQTIADEIQDHGTEAPLRPGTITKAESGKPQTLLLAGSDRRFGDGKRDARSDTLMLVRLDPRQNAISVLSIPRDLAVEIPGHGLAKINDAYSLGGLDLTTRTVKDLLSRPGEPFRVNHAVATTFSGFLDAVNHLRCVFTDVDRRYYHSNEGLPQSQHYSEIDIRAGYQKLCGEDALAYVRFRHLDNDLVRAARQQGFLREANDQLRHRGLLENLRPLVRIFAKATETDGDLRTTKGLLRLAHIAVDSSGKPVRQVQFPGEMVARSAEMPWLGAYVTSTPEQVGKAVEEFMRPAEPAVRVAKRRIKRAARAKRPDLADRVAEARALVRAHPSRPATRMTVLVPGKLTEKGRYAPEEENAPNPRRYVIEDGAGNAHAAYRLVMVEDEQTGQYYGMQGTTWKNPPLLSGGHRTQNVGGRAYRLYTDGGKLRYVAWSTAGGTYWVSNTLTLDLSNAQMLGIARSAVRANPPSRRERSGGRSATSRRDGR